MNELNAFRALTSTAAAVIGAESLVVASVTSTVAAPGIAGFLGFTTTATTLVALPVAGVIGAAGLLGYGLYKGVEYARKQSGQ